MDSNHYLYMEDQWENSASIFRENSKEFCYILQPKTKSSFHAFNI